MSTTTVRSERHAVVRDVGIARAVAGRAASALTVLRDAPPEPGLGLRGDLVAQRVVDAGLRAAFPDDAILSEEATDADARARAERVWIVDPLDGTREYGEAGRPDWAVHIALWSRGELTAGVVALPGVPAFVDSASVVPVGPAPERPLRLAVSRTRPPAVVNHLATVLDAELIPMGSAGYKILAVVRGEVDAYVHAGGQYEWDSAAPVAIARAAGLHASRIDGSPLEYNRPDPWLPDLLVCRPELADTLLTQIADGTAS